MSKFHILDEDGVELLYQVEAARLLGVSRQRVEQLLKSGRLGGRYIRLNSGMRRMVVKDSVEKWLKERG